MNRRSFLASIIGTAVLDPERLLWVHDRKTVFVPPTNRIVCRDDILLAAFGESGRFKYEHMRVVIATKLNGLYCITEG